MTSSCPTMALAISARTAWYLLRSSLVACSTAGSISDVIDLLHHFWVAKTDGSGKNAYICAAAIIATRVQETTAVLRLIVMILPMATFRAKQPLCGRFL